MMATIHLKSINNRHFVVFPVHLTKWQIKIGIDVSMYYNIYDMLVDVVVD